MLGWYALLQPRLRVYSARPRRRNGGASNRVRFFCCRECGARICYLHHLLGDEIVRQDKTQRCSAIGFNPVSMTHSFKRRNGARFALHITPIARVSPDQLSTPRVDHEFFPGVSWALCVCSDCGTWLGWIFGQHQTAYPVPVPTKKEHEDVALIRRPSTRGLRPSSARPTSRVVATRPSSGRPTSRVAPTRPSSGRPTSPVASALLPTPVIKNALDNGNATLTCKQPAACDVQAPSPPLTTTARAVTPGTTRSRVKKKSMVAVIMEEKRLQMLHASATRGCVNGRPNTASRGTQRRCGRRAEKGAPHGAKEEDVRDISSKKGEQCIIVECGKKDRPAIPRNENEKPAADVGRKSDAETEQPTEIMSEEKDEDAAVSKNEKGDVPRVVARKKDVASAEREESVILPLVANAHVENEKLLVIVPPETKDRFATAAILCEKEDQPAAAVAAVPQACDYAEEINPLVPVLETSMSRFLQKEMMETDNANNFNFCDLLVDEQSLDMEQLHAAKKPTCDYTALSQLASGRCARPPSGGHPRRRMSKDAPSVLSVGGLSNPSRICTTPTLDVAPSRDTKEDAPQADMTRVNTPPRVAPSAAKYEIMPGSPVKSRRNNEETSDKLRPHSWKEERVANKCDSERVAASIAEHRLDEHVVLDSARTVSTTASLNGDMSSSARSTAPSTRRKRLGTNNVPPMRERDASQEENLCLPQCTSSNKATTVSKPTRKSAKPAPDTLQSSRCSDDKDGTRPSAALKPSKGEDNLLNPSGDVGRPSTARKPLPNVLSAETRPQCDRGVRGDVQCGYAGRKGAFIASKQGSGVSPRTARAMKDETPARSEEWPDDAPSHRGNSINSCSKPTPLRTSLDGALKRPPSTYLPKTFARSTTGSRI